MNSSLKETIIDLVKHFLMILAIGVSLALVVSLN